MAEIGVDSISIKDFSKDKYNNLGCFFLQKEHSLIP